MRYCAAAMKSSNTCCLLASVPARCQASPYSPPPRSLVGGDLEAEDLAWRQVVRIGEEGLGLVALALEALDPAQAGQRHVAGRTPVALVQPRDAVGILHVLRDDAAADVACLLERRRPLRHHRAPDRGCARIEGDDAPERRVLGGPEIQLLAVCADEGIERIPGEEQALRACARAL